MRAKGFGVQGGASGNQDQGVGICNDCLSPEDLNVKIVPTFKSTCYIVLVGIIIYLSFFSLLPYITIRRSSSAGSSKNNSNSSQLYTPIFVKSPICSPPPLY